MSDPKEVVIKWYYRSKLNYVDRYINLFISYNAWFKKTINQSKDRDCINALKSRHEGLWADYSTFKVIQDLVPLAARISKITNEKPLQNLTGDNKHWKGVVRDEWDWPSLIEFWYRVRCNLFHGSNSPDDKREEEMVRLAYESLSIFMGEIVFRMEANFTKADLERLSELQEMEQVKEKKLNAALLHNVSSASMAFSDYMRTTKERQELMNKFQSSQNLWEIDLTSKG